MAKDYLKSGWKNTTLLHFPPTKLINMLTFTKHGSESNDFFSLI